MSFFPRNPISEAKAKTTAEALQSCLVTLVDLALTSKQAHWNVYGTQFLSVHEKLDDVVESARKGADTVAERMAQLGHSPDGRVPTLQKQSPLKEYPDGFQPVPDTLKHICDALHTATKTLREARETTEQSDPPTEDLIINIIQEIEEHLWMLQAMEKNG